MDFVKKYSNKIWEFIEENKISIFLFIITTLALLLRFSLFEYSSGDYEIFLEPWFDELKNFGGLYALCRNIGNYNAPYMTILALLTYIPVSSLVSIKLVSLIFDCVCAYTASRIALIIFKDSKHKEKIKLLVYSAVLFLPTVFLNSSCWGQADSIYTAFVLISLLFLIKQKYLRSFIFLGMAFAFKLQFIFILPLYILIYISERKFNIFHFFIPFIVNIVMCIPSIIFGNTFERCFGIYINQIGTYNQYATLNLPNVYSIFFDSTSSTLIETNGMVSTAGLFLTVFVFIILAFLVYYKKVKFDTRAIIEFGLWSILISTFLLPHMHDRYMYMADILAIIYLLYNNKKYYIPIAIEVISLRGYVHLLFSAYGLNMQILGIVYLVLMVIYSKDMYTRYFKEDEKLPEVQSD